MKLKSMSSKARIVRVSSLGVRNPKQMQIIASEKAKKIVSSVGFQRTGVRSEDDEGAATVPLTIAMTGFATNLAGRRQYWSKENSSGNLFDGEDFIDSLPWLQTQYFGKVSQHLGGVVKVEAGIKIHVPTVIGTSFIALQQALINGPVFYESIRHPDDPIIGAAGELSKGVGAKWAELPGAVNPWLAFGGYSALSGSPAGAYHLKEDLKQVACEYLLKKVSNGMDPKKAIIQLLAGANLNFAAVKPAAKLTLNRAQDYPVGPLNFFPNILLPQIFNDDGLGVILEVRDSAIDEAVSNAYRILKLGRISRDELEEYRAEAEKASEPRIEVIVEETETSAPKIDEGLNEAVQNIVDEIQ
ncbi:MAG: hypothetical protein JO170_06775 [Verrucomicrobia bacterium]|nr:hypothetical protein [Verrucomicrobiota bacterium]